MKIAYLLGSLNRGGTETLLLDIFKNSSNTNYEFIGIHRKGGILESSFYNTGVRIFKLAPYFKFDLIYLSKLRKLLGKENIDIVHAHQYIDAFYAWLACIGTGIKVVQTYHGYDDFDKKNSLIAFIISRIDKNIFVSNFQREYYIKKYKLKEEKQITIYNGISFDKFLKVNKHDIREEFCIPKNILLLGSVGNFVPVRDQLTICQFCKLLNEKGIDFRFLFIGKKSDAFPDLYDSCVNFIEHNNLEKKVLFIGSRDDVPNILNQLDSFIYSTDHDTFGIAVIEAIACGLPVFVNDWKVMKEITENGKFAMLYKTKDTQDLFDKFLLYIQDKEKYKDQASRNAIAVRKKYDIGTHIQNLNNLYNTIK